MCQDTDGNFKKHIYYGNRLIYSNNTGRFLYLFEDKKKVFRALFFTKNVFKDGELCSAQIHLFLFPALEAVFV